MTEEDKDLLFKDLCARLPYGVKGLRDYTDKVATLHFIIPNCKRPNDTTGFIELEFNDLDCCPIQEFKPYLRPLSSMTEEEENEFISLNAVPSPCTLPNHTRMSWYSNATMTDWLNAHHFDFRGLIEKGLAIEVTEENNPYN